jgi:hypothetical protein
MVKPIIVVDTAFELALMIGEDDDDADAAGFIMLVKTLFSTFSISASGI